MQAMRKQYKHGDRLIYEWDESLDAVTLFIAVPAFPPDYKPAFDIRITATHLKVGLKNTPPYLQHDLCHIVDSEESLWYIQDGKEIIIELQKAQKGVKWGGVFKGHQILNPVEDEELKKKIMLERFQEENPGFDFSQAEFNGRVPDARTFMGGVSYK